MEVKPMGEQLILSRPVVAGDYDAVESSLPLEPSRMASVMKAVLAQKQVADLRFYVG
jgi:hypothetical protein